VAEGSRIAVVDHYPIFRQGIVQALRRQKNFVVVGEGSTGEDAEKFASEKALDVLLLEVAVPNSLKVAASILSAHQNVKIIFLASIEDEEHALSALQAGAQGYIMKGISGPELVGAINVVSNGGRYISPDLAWRLVAKPASHTTTRETLSRASLSIREQQVLDCTSKGLTNREIGAMLGLGVSTIKHYKTLVFRKIGVRNRLEAAVAATKYAKQC
jgi:two-component system, NarL family, nitrate/nitrite response regulator NarL